MLSKDHIENFNEQTIRLYIPSFTVDAPDYDKIWCLFWWMIGQNWGFEKYSFNWLDYKIMTPITGGLPNDEIIPVWNSKYGNWIKMGIYSQPESFIYFVKTDWEFVEWECTNPRIQRLWIHLYNQVWAGRGLRQDLFETEVTYGRGLRHLHVDHGWWTNQESFNSRVHVRQSRPASYVPHYLNNAGRVTRHTPKFSGKIKQD